MDVDDDVPITPLDDLISLDSVEGASHLVLNPSRLTANGRFEHLSTPSSPPGFMYGGSNQFLPFESPPRQLPPFPLVDGFTTPERKTSSQTSALQQPGFGVPVVGIPRFALGPNSPEASPTPSRRGMNGAGRSLSDAPRALEPAHIITPPSSVRRQAIGNDDASTSSPSGSSRLPTTPPQQIRSHHSLTNLQPTASTSTVILESPSIDIKLETLAQTKLRVPSHFQVVDSPVKGRRLDLILSPSDIDRVAIVAAATAVGSPSPKRNGIRKKSSSIEPNKSRDARLSRRLDVFKEEEAQSRAKARKMRPPACAGEIPGQGRVVLLACGSAKLFHDDSVWGPALDLKPVEKKGKSKKRRRNGLALPPSPTHFPEPPAPDPEPDVDAIYKAITDEISWPDSEYPWCVRRDEERRRWERYHSVRMEAIRNYIEPETDGEEDDEVECGIPEYDETRKRERIGRSFDPFNVRPGSQRWIQLGPESADAREVFAVKCAVKLRRIQKGKTRVKVMPKGTVGASGDGEETDDEDVRCICNGAKEGEDMVMCDQCGLWYHLKCMGITLADLGETWYCPECLLEIIRAQTAQQRPVEPVLVPSSDDMPTVDGGIRLPYYQIYDTLGHAQPAAVHQTPHIDFRNQFRTPGTSTKTPLNSITDGRPPITPSRPRGKAANKTQWGNHQGLFEDLIAAPDSPFDPMSTPSRGVRVGPSKMGLMGTPRAHGWPSQLNLLNTPYERTIRENEASTSKNRLDFNLATPQSTWSASPLLMQPYDHRNTYGQMLHEFGGILGALHETDEATPDPDGMNDTAEFSEDEHTAGHGKNKV